MTSSSLPWFDRTLEYLRTRYLPARRRGRTGAWTTHDLNFFAPGAALVSEGFTSERSEMPRNYFNRPEYRSGYLLYFLASNVPKVMQCLRIVNAATRFAGQDRVRILDLGCGPGTAALACAEYWRSTESKQLLDITGVDQNKAILQDANALFTGGAYTTAGLRTINANVDHHLLVSRLRKQTYDVIVLANLLNEFGNMEQREKLVAALLRHHLTDSGVLIIIEPALQGLTRALMELRDRLLPVAPVLAPCLHQAACPMLTHNRRDWCHAYLDWKRPAVIGQVDQLIGNRKDHLKFSYVIFATPGTGRQSSVAGNSTTSGPDGRRPATGDVVAVTGNRRPATGDALLRFRVVSAPLLSAGKSELLLCPAIMPEGGRLHRLTRLHKEHSPSNADFARVLRGDLVETISGERLVSGDTFRIVQPFHS